LRKRGVSLLAVGVTQVEGQFQRGELVACLTDQGVEIARGLSNYDSDASKLIAGCSSEKFEQILGYTSEEELINRDNLVLTTDETFEVRRIKAHESAN